MTERERFDALTIGMIISPINISSWCSATGTTLRYGEDYQSPILMKEELYGEKFKIIFKVLSAQGNSCVIAKDISGKHEIPFAFSFAPINEYKIGGNSQTLIPNISKKQELLLL